MDSFRASATVARSVVHVVEIAIFAGQGGIITTGQGAAFYASCIACASLGIAMGVVVQKCFNEKQKQHVITWVLGVGTAVMLTTETDYADIGLWSMLIWTVAYLGAYFMCGSRRTCLGRESQRFSMLVCFRKYSFECHCPATSRDTVREPHACTKKATLLW